MKIIIPMAGEGSRFTKAGFSLPKPLIDVEGKPMIQKVIENLPFDAEFIFLVRTEHLNDYRLEPVLSTATSGKCKIVPVSGLTEGAVCTVLLAKDLINTSEPIIISNCDEIMEYSVTNFKTMLFLSDPQTDFIWVFQSPDLNPKWSFARIDSYGRIVQVAEKQPISYNATCGVYYWGQGSTFVSCAEEMVRKNVRVKNEFYICPVYNEGISVGRKVFPFFVEKMWGLGTPKDLDAYLNRA